MPRTCMISGSFIRHEQPVQGLVRFTPSRLWVVSEGITWACLAPEVRLAPDGSFVAFVTATDADEYYGKVWTYLIDTPAGSYEAYVPWSEPGYTLPGLLSEHGVKLPT